jgi:hypothetical protein
MSQERLIRRYAPFFEGWAQALGNHRGGLDELQPRNWLIGEDVDQIGLILTQEVLAGPFRDIAAEPADRYSLSLGPGRIGVNRYLVPMADFDEEPMRILRWLFDAPGDLHLYQTYHLFYPSGTRILTLSRKAPLAIMYKEIDPILIRFA